MCSPIAWLQWTRVSRERGKIVTEPGASKPHIDCLRDELAGQPWLQREIAAQMLQRALQQRLPFRRLLESHWPFQYRISLRNSPSQQLPTNQPNLGCQVEGVAPTL